MVRASLNNPVYKACLSKFLEFKFGEGVIEATEDQLLQITDDDIVRYLNKQAYGAEEPTADARPTHGRSTTLECIKKKLSVFMTRCNLPWDSVRREGNPTR